MEWAVPPSQAVPGRQPEPTSAASSNRSEPGGGSPGAPLQAQQHKWAAPPRRISRVVLVGQSTRLPAIQSFVERITGITPQMSVDPAEAVALGAAVQVRGAAVCVCGRLNRTHVVAGTGRVACEGCAWDAAWRHGNG